MSSGIIPANLLDSFIIAAMKLKKKTRTRVITKSRILTSDEYIAMDEKKIDLETLKHWLGLPGGPVLPHEEKVPL